MGVVVPITTRPAPACVGQDLALFFEPEGGETWEQRTDREAEAKRVCARCPVCDECLADHFNEKFGIFGGLTASERQSARRKERRVTAGAA